MVLIDCVHKTPPAAQSGLPYLAIPQMKAGSIDLRGARLISRQHFEQWTQKASPSLDDVVLSRRCNPGVTAAVPRNTRFALGQNLVLLRADGSRVHKPFLKWLVRSPDWWEQVGKFINVGAVFDSLRCADVPKFELPVPPLDEQRRIAAVLGALDDKIELNRKMNRTLEEMAQATFKSWFIDFDGVPDSEMVESELGPIPKGWRSTTWGSVCTLAYGKGLKDYRGESGTAQVFGTNGPIGWTARALRDEPTVIVGRKGAYRGVHFSVGPSWTIDTAFYLRTTEDVVMRWAYYALLQYDINAMDSGSAIPSTSREAFYAMPLVLPRINLQRRFASTGQPLWARQAVQLAENATLSDLRDTLLPKLISGEIRVPEAERAVEAVL